MTNEELIDKLEAIIAELKCDTAEEAIGYKDDEVFLLSIEEYEKYEDIIPDNNVWWWLRSPGRYAGRAAYVSSSGEFDSYGDNVNYSTHGILPALHLYEKTQIGKEIIYNNRPFTVIDDYLAIASVPIAFGKFDDVSNDYENSYIRKWLIDWSENDD